MEISQYRVKRCLLTPHTWFMRRKYRNADPVARHILETQYYRPAIFSFMRATTAEPDLLVHADLDSTSKVFDVGAYVGEWSEQIAGRYACEIYAFEPNPNAFRRMSERLGRFERVHLFDFGLDAADGKAVLALDGPGSTVFRDHGTFGTTDIRLRDVVEVLRENEIDALDLLKLNIEGGEYDLLDRLIGARWLPRIRLLSVQFHEWHPRAYARRRAIRDALRQTHNEVWSYPFVWELWRRKEHPR